MGQQVQLPHGLPQLAPPLQHRRDRADRIGTGIEAASGHQGGLHQAVEIGRQAIAHQQHSRGPGAGR